MAAEKISWALCFTVIAVLIALWPASSHASFVTDATGNADFGGGDGWNATDADGTVSYAAYNNMDGRNWTVDLGLAGAVHTARPDVDWDAPAVIFYQIANDSPFGGGDPLAMIDIDIIDPVYITSFGYLWKNEGYSFNMGGTGVGAGNPLTSGYNLDEGEAFLLDDSSVRPSAGSVDESSGYLQVGFPGSESVPDGGHSTVFYVTTNQTYVDFSDAALHGPLAVAVESLPVPSAFSPSAILVQVPEPMSVMMMLSGIPFVVLAARWRRRVYRSQVALCLRRNGGC